MKIYKISSALFVSATVLLIFQNSGWGFSEGSYEQKVTVDGNEIAKIKVAFKDGKMKAESNFGGMTAWMLRNETGAYSYLPAQNVATKIPASMDRPNLTQDLPRFMKFLQENGGKKIGSEKVGDRQLAVYSFTEPSLKKDAKAWVWEEKEFPVKIEVAAPEGKTVIELENIDFSKIDEAVFQLPAGAKIVDLGAPPPAQPATPVPPAPTTAASGPQAIPIAEEKTENEPALKIAQ